MRGDLNFALERVKRPFEPPRWAQHVAQSSFFSSASGEGEVGFPLVGFFRSSPLDQAFTIGRKPEPASATVVLERTFCFFLFLRTPTPTPPPPKNRATCQVDCFGGGFLINHHSTIVIIGLTRIQNDGSLKSHVAPARLRPDPHAAGFQNAAASAGSGYS